jgi:hypothetical protein
MSSHEDITVCPAVASAPSSITNHHTTTIARFPSPETLSLLNMVLMAVAKASSLVHTSTTPYVSPSSIVPSRRQGGVPDETSGIYRAGR